MSARIAVVFGQFGAVADPVNLPHFRDRLTQAGVETILVQHTDTQEVYDFLYRCADPVGVIGASLGAGVAPIMAGYVGPKLVAFVGGFQPSDWDPVMHRDPATGLMTVCVPGNCVRALCFRNPVAAATGGLGHAIYKLADGNTRTKLTVIERPDIHPGDFPPASDTMYAAAMEAIR
jgi:hypothetical protein